MSELVIPTDLPADARAQLLQAGVEESHVNGVRSFDYAQDDKG